MKLLKFVSCCGGGDGGGEVRGREVVAEAAAAVRRRTEETTALMVAAPRKVWRDCRRRRGRERSGAEWKPTLGSISEDNFPVVAERVAESAVKRKSGSSGGGGRGNSSGGRRDSRDIASIPAYDEDYDYRRARYTSVFPAFAPTPFML